jgi:DNA-binding transcriptional LysR family regulator
MVLTLEPSEVRPEMRPGPHLCFVLMNGLELRHLQALVALAEEGTFTDAAIRLGISQSAVSRTVVALEQIVLTRLVERTTRTVALTPAGERVYAAAILAIASVDDVVRAAHGTVRPLRLGYAWSALGRHTTAVLQRWRTEHPEVPLEVHRIDERAAGLARGAVDIGVIRGRVDDGDLTTQLIFDEPRMAAFPTAHRLAGRSSVRLGELTADTVLLTANGTTTLELWPAAIRPQSTLHVDNLDEWLTEIAGGLAVGVTVESTAILHAHPGIAFVPVSDAGRVTVQLAWPAKRAHPATADFVALVTEVVSTDEGGTDERGAEWNAARRRK